MIHDIYDKILPFSRIFNTMANPAYGYRLKKNYEKVLEDLEPKKLVNRLYQEEVFDLDEKDEVMAEKTRKDRANVLLGKIQRAGDHNMVIFVNALQRTQRHLYELLQRPLPGELLQAQLTQAMTPAGSGIEDITRRIRTEMVFNEELPTCIYKALHPNTHPPLLGNTDKGAAFCQNSEDRELLVPPEGQPCSFVTPTDWGKIPGHISPQSELVYPMTSKPRGIVLIINNENFGRNSESTEKEQKQEELDIRHGSETDVKELENLFEALDFKPRTKRNIGRNEILKVLDDVSQEDHSAYDCFVLWLMSHGKDGKLYGADGETVPIESIRDFFNSANCPSLKGKPKLIFIQACRGSEKVKGVVADSPHIPTRQPSTHDGEMPAEEPESSDTGYTFHISKSIPVHADMLIANSTISGYVSYRNEVKGSRFVRCIVEVFREFAGHEDLLSMLTMVNKRVSEMGEIGTKQVSEPSTTLTKKLYFWPGE